MNARASSLCQPPRRPPAPGSRRASRLAVARVAALGALCIGAATLTGGCASIGAASGAAAGAATGIVTANPGIGIGVGIAVQAATDVAVNTFMRNMHTDQQNAIASAAGALPVGGTQPWSVKHKLPVENGHGEVRVTRAFASSLALCKEFLFSVRDGDGPNAPERWFTASACHDEGTEGGWKWASAEPAVERWGALQ